MNSKQKDAFLLYCCNGHWEIIAAKNKLLESAGESKSYPVRVEIAIYRFRTEPEQYLVSQTIYAETHSFHTRAIVNPGTLSSDVLFTKSESRDFETLWSDSGREIQLDKKKSMYFENSILLRFQRDLTQELKLYIAQGMGKTENGNVDINKTEESPAKLIAELIAVRIQKYNKEYSSFDLRVFTSNSESGKHFAIVSLLFEKDKFAFLRLVELQAGGLSISHEVECVGDGTSEYTANHGKYHMRLWSEDGMYEGMYFTMNEDQNEIFESNSSLAKEVDRHLVELLSKQCRLDN